MPTYAIRAEADRKLAISYAEKKALPFTASFKNGTPRTNQQNNLQYKWHLEAGQQGDSTADEYRGYCKLHFGVPILRAEDADFRAAYNKVILDLTYEQKLLLMQSPLDFPVTQLMSTKQLTKYLDQVYVFYTEQGFLLTQPQG